MIKTIYTPLAKKSIKIPAFMQGFKVDSIKRDGSSRVHRWRGRI
jgi:hypothetical protein